MRASIALALTLGLAACSQGPGNDPAASSRYTFWRPAPVENAVEPSEVIKASAPADWRTIDPENLMIVDLKDGSRIAIELAPAFAPVHVANIKAFARAGWWNNSAIYRVQDNYVVQWGNGDATNPLPAGVVKTPPAEYDRALAGLDIRPLGFPDSYAPGVGHADGWPVA